MEFYEWSGKLEAFIFCSVIKASTYYTPFYVIFTRDRKFIGKGRREYRGKTKRGKVFIFYYKMNVSISLNK